MTQIAFIMHGHSEWHDLIWAWLGRHRLKFDEIPTGWDYVGAIGVMVQCGCTVHYQPSNADGFRESISLMYDGDVNWLLMKLNRLTGLK